MTGKRLLSKRNCHVAFAIFFVALAVGVALVPYEPMEWDLADATANYVWTGYYAEGRTHVSYDEWNSDWDGLRTQVVVVEHDGEYVVVNEKGPGLAAMLVPFRLAGAEFLFGPLMLAFAAIGTYLLGRRVGGWKVGLAAAAMVAANVIVLVMCHRYYWTDAATMHLLVLGFALFVESFYILNGRTLDPREEGAVLSRRDWLVATALGILAGLSFGAAVSTRYAAALTILALLCFLIAFYGIKLWPYLRKGEVKGTVGKSRGFIAALVFLLGLAVVLVPLCQYNSEYFGGPFRSGYDATLIFKFDPAVGIDPRNTSTTWSADIDEMASTAASNFFLLLPTLCSKMPALLLAPFGIWMLRRKTALALLLPWIAVGLATYLSLSWVDMYARLSPDVVWEPRYFMAVLPAIAILGAVPLARLSERGFKFHVERDEAVAVGGKAFAIAIVGIIALWGMAPAFGHFAQIGDDYQTPGGGPGGPDGGAVLNVTTDQLLQNPNEYEGKSVHLARATVVSAGFNSVHVRSDGSASNGSVPVRFEMWPPGAIPMLRAGDVVEVEGMFLRTPDGHALGVKFGTRNYVRIVDQAP